MKTAGTFIDAKAAVVRTSFAFCHARLKLQGIDFMDGKHRRPVSPNL